MFEFLGFGKKDVAEVSTPEVEQPVIETEKESELRFEGGREVFFSESEALKYIADELNKSLKLGESSRDSIRYSNIKIEEFPVKDTGKVAFEGGGGGWSRTMTLRATIKDKPIQDLEIIHHYGVSDSKNIVGNPSWEVKRPKK
jgi:hypothetical protein